MKKIINKAHNILKPLPILVNLFDLYTMIAPIGGKKIATNSIKNLTK